MKIGVIGAGLGGLSVAIRLAHKGYDVTVFEQSSTSGGKAGTLTLGNCRFDTGPSLITMIHVLEELFTDVQENISDYISLIKLPVICKYFYPDGTIINGFNSPALFAEEIEKTTLDSKDQILNYLNYCKNIYNLSSDLFLGKSFGEISTFTNTNAIKTLLNFSGLDVFRTMDRANRTFFKDEKTIQLFNRYATYNGSSPYKVPATLNIIQHVEYGLGAYSAKGGVRAIAEGLEQLALKKGVRFVFNSTVQRIDTLGNRLTGITANSQHHPFDKVVSNADVYFTYDKLLNDSVSPDAKRYKKLEPSTSALVFYWSVKGKRPELEAHNILFTSHYKEEFSFLFERGELYHDPTVYIYISSKFEPGDADENTENWFVMINVPNTNVLKSEIDISTVRKNIQKKINSALAISIENLITKEHIMTPADIEKNTNSKFGSIYGISSNSRNAAFMRQHNRSKHYKGLYFTGGSAHPGGGIPLVLLSGKITAELIEKYKVAE